MRKSLVLLVVAVALLACSPVFAAQPDQDAVLAWLTPSASTGANCSPELFAGRTAQPMACVDLYCEWRDGGCRNLSSTWNQTWKYKWCLTNCGYYWYNTGQTCCYTSQPGQC